jgi:hypothetical protein
MFTTDSSKAPVYRLGQVKCFLHPQSNERPILQEIGIGNTCAAAHLANSYSKRIHAQHRHKQEWAMYQEWVEEQEKEGDKSRQQGQIDAMMALAGKAAGEPARSTRAKPVSDGPAVTCPTCGKECANDFGLKAHMRSHKEAE